MVLLGERVISRCAAVFVALAGLASTSCIFSRMFYYNIPTLAAPRYFPSRTVAASPTPVPLRSATVEARPALTNDEKRRYASFDEFLETNETRAFLAIRDDEVVYERYFKGVTAKTLLPAFSISKTFAALLVGCAIDDGLFASTDTKVTKLIPELGDKSGYQTITIDHLLRMTSGIDFTEESAAGAMFYYSKDLRSRLYLYDVKYAPGTHYEYGSVNTQLLWDALQRKLKGRTVTEYFAERVWGPLGADQPAAWSLDSASGGVEKLFGGFNATTRDHARIGLLFLHGGTLGGRKVVDPSWIHASLTHDDVAGVLQTTDGWVQRGKYQWFITLDRRAYFAKGYHGQYIFLVPDKKMVFVRFADGYGDVDWPALFIRLADAT